MDTNMYLQVGEEVDYKRVVLEFNRYLNESKLLYARDIYAVEEEIKETWDAILKGDFIWFEKDEPHFYECSSKDPHLKKVYFKDLK